MALTMLRAIVKVGKSSSIKFRGVSLLRAITLKEVSNLIKLYDDISFIVFEDINIIENEKFIVEMLNEYATTMIVYKQDIDEKEREICENNGIGYVNNNIDLYNYIDSNIGEYVGIYPKEETNNEDIDEIIEEQEEEETTENISLKSIFEDDEEEDFEELDKSLRDLDEAYELTRSIDDNDQDTTEQVVQNKSITYKEELDSYEENDIFKEFIEENKDNDVHTEIEGEVLEKLNSLEEDKQKLTERLEYANNQVRNLNEIRISLEDELKECKSKLQSIYIEEDVTEVVLGDNGEKEYKHQIEELEIRLANLTAKISELKEVKQKVEELNEEINNKNSEIESLNATIKEYENDNSIDMYKSRLSLEVKSRLNLVELVNQSIEKIAQLKSELSSEIEDKDEVIRNYDELKAVSDRNENIIKQLKSEKERLIVERDSAESKANNKVNELKSKLSNMNVEKLSLEAEIESKDSVILEKESKIQSLTEEIVSNNEIINDNQKLIEGQQIQLNKYKSLNINGLKEQVRQKDLEALRYKNEIDRQKSEIDRLRKANIESAKETKETNIKDKSTMLAQINKYKDLSTKLTSENSSLKYELEIERSKNQSLMNSNSYDTELVLDYKSRGCIIPVYGGGSYGVTTTVMSLAYKLEGRVLIMDLDTVAPKIESWVKKKPYINDADDIPNKMNATCFGAVLYKGVDYFLDRENKFIQTIVNTKTGRVDYFSGCYTGVKYKQVESVDWTQLMNSLGNEYNYIVIDLGRLGGSEAGTAMIKMFNSISFNDVAVSLHSDGDIRSMVVRMQTSKLKRDKKIWLLNMAENNKMTENMKKSIGNGEYVVMSKHMPIYNKLKRYDTAGMLKATLSDLVNKVLG